MGHLVAKIMAGVLIKSRLSWPITNVSVLILLYHVYEVKRSNEKFTASWYASVHAPPTSITELPAHPSASSAHPPLHTAQQQLW